MTPTRLFVLAFVLVAVALPAVAQERVRLQFEITRDGATVGRPLMGLSEGEEGRMEIDDFGTIAFTPTLRAPGQLAVSFDIDSGGRHMTPRLVIGDDAPGTMRWTSEGDAETFELTVAWVR